ncbi:18596_t:CDS:2, partial [Racocetra fulgida]
MNEANSKRQRTGINTSNLKLDNIISNTSAHSSIEPHQNINEQKEYVYVQTFAQNYTNANSFTPDFLLNQVEPVDAMPLAFGIDNNFQQNDL